MSRTWSKPIGYKCLNDCEQAGCPGHSLQLEYYGTADVTIVWIDEKAVATFDDSAFSAIMKAARKDE